MVFYFVKVCIGVLSSSHLTQTLCCKQ